MPGEALTGKWVFDHGEGMEAVIQAASIPADKVPKDGNTSFDIQVNGNTITVTGTHTATGKSKSNVFQIGQAHDAEELSKFAGKAVRGTPSWDGDKLVIRGEGGQASVTREVIGDQMVVSIQFGSAVGKRFFNRA